jgi:hypothetical protein
MASAFVTGVTALLVERRPDITTQAVISLLNETSAGGSINACRALAALSAGNARCQADGNDSGVVTAALSNTRR